MSRGEYWQNVHLTRSPDRVGWYEQDPVLSRRLVADAVRRGASSVIDVGGGASALVDQLLELGVPRIAILDISDAGLAVAKARLGERADGVAWIVGDVTRLDDIGTFDVWHDRAVFHFLVDRDDRERYVRLAQRTVSVGGTAIIGAFAPDGPDQCSGLPVRRYDAERLAETLGPGFRLEASERHTHTTPRGVAQPFLYSTFTRVASAT